MLRNYITIALRNIRRSKVYSLINILGLSIGVACCLMLALYIQDEMSYDKYHNRLDDLYRVTTHFEGHTTGSEWLGSVSPPIAMALQQDIPEVESAVRLINPPGLPLNLIKYKDNIFYEKDGFLTDSTLFDVLTYEFIEGSTNKALTQPNTVIINDKLATKLFDHDAAIDKMITINDDIYKVTGVFRDNEKTFTHANFITSITSSSDWGEYLRSEGIKSWAGQNFVPAFVKLTPGHNKAEVEKKMNLVLQKYGADDLKALGMSKTLGLEPVKDVYLKSSIGHSPRIIYIYVIASIALFILLIACINFMNLSTARATKRANEIGVRKVMGAVRSSLIAQILGEAMLIVLFSIACSLVFMQLALPYFNQLTSKNISFEQENFVYLGSALLIITLLTGLVAGSYPAFYLSSFQPAEVLKGKFALSNASGWLRRSLVVFQFMIAIALVCGMLIISHQLTYIQEKDLGFDSKAKIIIPLRSKTASEKYDALLTEISKNSTVKLVSGASYLPGSPVLSDMKFYKEGGNMDNALGHRRNYVDFNYPELLNVKLLAGRTFTGSREQDAQVKLIINHTSAKRLGYAPEEAIGKPLFFDLQGEHYEFEIIGVIEDYHQMSLKDEIYPMMFELVEKTSDLNFLVAYVDSHDFASTVASIEQTWKSLVNDTPFEYSFLDDDIQKQYDEDKKVSTIINSFTIIAMFISCLGLYGLSMYMAERRFKEIGIRKVLGANVSQIVGMMSKEFVKLIIVAFILSVPMAWYFMNKWLDGFAYHEPINGLIFVYAGAAALFIALLTVSFESLKAASANPVKSLKDE